MVVPRKAKKLQIFDETFYAIREKMSYMGYLQWGATLKFCQKFGWNIYNFKGAFIVGGPRGGHVIATLKECRVKLFENDETRIKQWAKLKPQYVPFKYFSSSCMSSLETGIARGCDAVS